MRVHHLAGVPVLVAVGFGGCGDSKGPSARERHCQAICERFEMCDDRTDVLDCESSCAAESYRSDRYFAAKERCTTGNSCNRIMGEFSELENCIGDDLRGETLSDEAENFCTALANQAANCNSTSEADRVEQRCAALALTLSAEYLDAAGACMHQLCTNISSCFADLDDSYDAKLSLYPSK